MGCHGRKVNNSIYTIGTEHFVLHACRLVFHGGICFNGGRVNLYYSVNRICNLQSSSFLMHSPLENFENRMCCEISFCEQNTSVLEFYSKMRSN